jgi:hypothetical protein
VGGTDVLDISLDGATVIAYNRSAATGDISYDGGQSFTELPTGFPVDSLDVVGGLPVESVVGALGMVLYQRNTPGRPPDIFPISPLDGRAVFDMHIAKTGGGLFPTIFGRTSGTIEVANLIEVDEPIRLGDLAALTPPAPDVDDNRLQPAREEIRMPRGDTRTVPYTLKAPEDTTPLDVYFMIDISGSMGGTISGVRSAMQEIVDRLDALDIDVHFGVGSFRAYEDPPAYEQDRDIGPVDAELESELNGLRSSGGGLETQMAALLQSVTGKGDYNIQPGLNMNFRPGSLRVAIEVTDEEISQGGRHPSYDTVIAALRKYDVKQVGLAIQEPPLLGEYNYDDPGFGPAIGLQRVATGSGAIAPAAGPS